MMNPWVSIWTRPRHTIREIVDTDPRRRVMLLAMIGGVLQTMDRASSKTLGETMGLTGVLATCLLVGVILGPIGLYIGAAVLRWTGKLLGGVADSIAVRAALAWSNVPLLAAGVLWLPQLLITGRELFMKESPTLNASPGLAQLVMVLGVIQAVLGIWAVVILLKSLAEVHRFSAWRALVSVLLPILALAVLLVGITAIVH